MVFSIAVDFDSLPTDSSGLIRSGYHLRSNIIVRIARINVITENIK